MNILICGARGFIGAHLSAALTQAGHHVIRGVSSQPQAGDVGVDYVHDTQASDWLPRLSGVDAVINAVGVLRDTPRQPMQAIHADTPKALFEACAQLGIRRVIQISALGIAASDSRYARTKRLADEALLALNATDGLNGVVVRPSVVFGRGGDSSAMFVQLAQLPLLLLPKAVIQTRVQPIAVQELAEIVVQLLTPQHDDVRGVIEVAGPQALPIAELVSSLREQAGHAAAKIWPIADALTMLTARLGDLVPITPWGTDALSLLANDNTTDSGITAQILGRDATHYSALRASYTAN